MNLPSKADLASFEPIPFHELLIYKPTIREISKMGWSHFNRLNSILLVTQEDLEIQEDDFIRGRSNVFISETDPYKYIVQACEDPLYFLELRLALFTYLKRDCRKANNMILIEYPVDEKDKTKGNKFFPFTSETFFEFQSIVRELNCLKQEEEHEFSDPNNPMAKKFLEARKKKRIAKARAARRAAQEGKGVDTSTVMFALCAMSSYTMETVQSLTIYQLFTQFALCQEKQAYELAYTPHVFSGGKSKLKYWIPLNN